MSKVIPVTVRDKIATAPDDALYVCGNSDFAIKFDFDGEWDAYDTKTARFTYNGTYQDKVFSGDECPVPVISDTYSFKVGVFAGNLNTTTPAHVSAKKSILCGSGSPAAPSLDVYAQIMEMLKNGGSSKPYVLPIASSDGIGGVKADTSDWLLTKPVKITPEGYLVIEDEVSTGPVEGPPGAPGEDGYSPSITLTEYAPSAIHPNGALAITVNNKDSAQTVWLDKAAPVDATLKNAGQAADSAATGAALNQLNEDIAAVVKESETEPETESTGLWVKPSSETLKIPQINDDAESEEDTWSGKKIASAIRAAIDGLPNASGVTF